MAQEEKKRGRRSDTLMYTAYQTIKEEICTGVIRSGELLSETQLAARMGISRTPLREALAALENEGLVEIKRGVGAKVRPLSFGDMIHVYELRKVLESRGITVSAIKGPEGNIEFLGYLWKQGEDSVPDLREIVRQAHEELDG